jgi:hypothetical protein
MQMIREENTFDEQPLCRHIGSGAVIWRHGFRTGAVDALRLAARRLPPDQRAVLEQLSNEYADERADAN